METTLTPIEMRLTGELGLSRRITSLSKAMNDKQIGGQAWDIDINGAMGEYALAKILKIPWEPTLNTFKVPDVGDLHVRTTTFQTGRLIIRPGDPYGIYVLIIANAPIFRAAGWVNYHTGQFPLEYWTRPSKSGPECWAIPQEYLVSISELK